MSFKIVYNTKESEIPGFYEIPGFNRYCVNVDGTVLRKKTGRAISPATHKGFGTIRGGYKTFMLMADDDVRRGYSRHRLLMTIFREPPTWDGVAIVNHINGIGGDDRHENIEWSTYSKNVKHAYDTGLMSEKVRSIEVYLQKEDVYLTFPTIAEAAITLNLVTNTLYGRLRKHSGKLFSDGLAVKYVEDKWDFSRIVPVGSPPVRVMARCIKTGVIHVFDNMRQAESVIGIAGGSIGVCLRRPVGKRFLMGYELRLQGEKHPWTKLTQEQIELIEENPHGKYPLIIQVGDLRFRGVRHYGDCYGMTRSMASHYVTQGRHKDGTSIKKFKIL